MAKETVVISGFSTKGERFVSIARVDAEDPSKVKRRMGIKAENFNDLKAAILATDPNELEYTPI